MVDLETVAIVALTVQGANQGDTTTLTKTLIEVAETIEQVMPEKEMTQVVVDKGMHSIQRIVYLRELGVSRYVCEPDTKRCLWEGDCQAVKVSTGIVAESEESRVESCFAKGSPTGTVLCSPVPEWRDEEDRTEVTP